jgi:LmbE family N-acetylglucosaminyl deacetylase
MLTLRSPAEGVNRVLVVTAHPDDVDFGAAGTVAAFTDSGVPVSYCIVTDGDAGNGPDGLDRAQVGELRRREQRAAAAAVGVTDVTFLGFPDGRLEASLQLRLEITRVIRTVRPDLVITQSPERDWGRVYASHPDHLAAGEAATCAVYPDSRNPFAFPELAAQGLEPHTVPELWLMAAPSATVAVETTSTFDAKVRALMCHRSQVGDGVGLESRLREWASGVGQAAGLPEGRLAEGFLAARTV